MKQILSAFVNYGQSHNKWNKIYHQIEMSFIVHARCSYIFFVFCNQVFKSEHLISNLFPTKSNLFIVLYIFENDFYTLNQNLYN